MLKKLIFTLLLIALPLNSSIIPPEPARQPSAVDEQIKYVAAGSLALLAAGLAANNNLLTSTAVGMATGTACAIAQKRVHWGITWPAEIVTRVTLCSLIGLWLADRDNLIPLQEQFINLASSREGKIALGASSLSSWAAYGWFYYQEQRSPK